MKDPLGKLLLEWRIRQVLPHLRGDVLDVGCGTNALLRAYKALHPECRSLGVDVHPWEGVDVLVEDSGALPFDAASFDSVCCIAALNHIPNREAFLREAHRLLRPSGRFLMTMIPQGISRVWHMLRSPWDADQHERGMEEGEVYGLSGDQVSALLRAAGFASPSKHSFMLGVNTLYVAAKEIG